MNYTSVITMFCIIIIFCFLNLSETASKFNHLRVMKGLDVADEEYPYVVLLAYKTNISATRFCSGSAISKKWVLTAGHCVEYEEPEEIVVWHTNFTVPTVEVNLLTKVLNIIMHPRYYKIPSIKYMEGTANDISLLHTEELTVARYGRLLAVDHMTMIGLPVEYVGGGADAFVFDQDINTPLKKGKGAIITCDKQVEGMYQMYKICVHPECSKKTQSVFVGDSGGPLVFRDNIIGVASAAEIKFFLSRSVFTPVSPYIDWIHNVIQKYG